MGGFSIRRRAANEGRQLEADLARSREFRLVRVSSDERQIELLPDHRVRPCRSYEHYWHVADGRDGLELRIEGNGLRSCALRQSGDGTWHGRYLQSPGMPLELVPAGAGKSAETRCDGADRAALLSVIDRIFDFRRFAAM